ncbi:AraC family transcriptional regulator [Hymenobacter tibetensis]|uniref:AraC family transcriptional regulator n=1 Tax=Hymenobacter tibetensis TaxID=497967 RepID=A0ABY4CSU2_9BACT|nr:AraC family transcriptional regulator [Hymenobacter tibetensis]UOG72837.1 AraC family transcriptional regulator [Hymenobacter tibetensis]
MKIVREHIEPDAESSFRLLFTPCITDIFFWHYHPEYELVYIEGANGTRHVGDHISRYEGSDLVFIGPNIPHLNFDYGVATEPKKVVVQLKDHFLGDAFKQTPEFAAITQLFERARFGVSFHGHTKDLIGRQLAQLPDLPPFERLLTLLRIFQQLATSNDHTLLHGSAVTSTYNLQEQQRIQRVSEMVAEHYPRKIEIREVAALTNLTEAAFCRYFKRITRLTFTQFLNQYRVHQAQKLLLQDTTVSEACFACGFENLSYFTKTFKRVTGENPLQFKKRLQA